MARRPKVSKLVEHKPLQRLVAKKLQLDWSPEQISGWLKETFPKGREPARVAPRPSTRASSFRLAVH